MERFKGTSFEQAHRLERRVRSYLLLYAECKDAELAERRQAEEATRRGRR